MITYAETDLNRQLAEAAHRGVSHVPQKRADQEIAGYMAEMERVANRFAPFATATNEASLKADLERYRVGYLKHLNARLSAMSRVISPMVAGPSNFPTRRMEKRNGALDKRTQEFVEWREKALDRLDRTYNPAILARAPIRADEADAIEQLEAKIAAAEADQAAMKAVNKIIRDKKLSNEEKVARIDSLHLSQALLKVFYRAGEGKFPAYRLTNNNANIRRMKERLVTLQAEAVRAEVDDRQGAIAGTPVTIVENREETRLQLFFRGKPPEPVLAILNGRGFHWSRSEGAWQRLLNDNARRTVESILD